MRTLTITYPCAGEHGLLNVTDECGRHCDGLAFDEMMGQVVALTHPQIGRPQYAMRTDEEWQALRDARAVRIKAFHNEAPEETQ